MWMSITEKQGMQKTREIRDRDFSTFTTHCASNKGCGYGAKAAGKIKSHWWRESAQHHLTAREFNEKTDLRYNTIQG